MIDQFVIAQMSKADRKKGIEFCIKQSCFIKLSL